VDQAIKPAKNKTAIDPLGFFSPWKSDYLHIRINNSTQNGGFWKKDEKETPSHIRWFGMCLSYQVDARISR